MTHGYSRHPDKKKLYATWQSMRRRCNDPRVTSYPQYGGRGITVCERWNKFENFLADMGHKPGPEYSLERIDNDGPYSKENCKWATDIEQAQNKKNNIKVTFGGATRSLSYWCDMFKMSHATASSRIKVEGMSPQEALTTPLKHKRVKVGERFGNLVVFEIGELKKWNTVNKHTEVICNCDCGEKFKTVDTHLKFRNVTQCKACQRRK